ncbi:hypothetical protein LIS44_00910 [Acinetobacter haemolyticus]|nr:hypothetical protein LIS44_00910 [Acinetobacter haemolyticus]
MQSSQNPFIRNRTEEFEHDIWSYYILPPYFKKLGMQDVRKSIILQGGRGCGKTSLLRYLSFQSQFSSKRIDIPEQTFATIGLYLKADIQYYTGFYGLGLSDEAWKDYFEHELCLALAEQILVAVRQINCSPARLEKYGQLQELNFNEALSGFVDSIPVSLEDFYKWIRQQRQKFAMWLRNVDDEDQAKPKKLPLKLFLDALIGELKNKLIYLKNSIFAIYIDEYENLLDYQQELLNTFIKAFEPPLIIHIAMKPNGMRTKKTTGAESIQETADYRLLDLDALLAPHFKLFCAELFCFRLIDFGIEESKTPVSKIKLQSVECIEERLNNSTYQKKLFDLMNELLPGKTNSEIAYDIISDNKSAAYKKWVNIVEDGLALKGSELTAKDFYNLQHPEASIVCAALLNQKTKTVQTVLDEFNKEVNNELSRFTKGEWIHHYLLGTLLLIYLPLTQTTSPIYVGFDTFVKLSGTCVRYFLELCHLAIDSNKYKEDLYDFKSSLKAQAEAANLASRKFHDEISGCGNHGNLLKLIVGFLGRFFKLSQERKSQSEPEKTHFSYIGDLPDSSLENILSEAIKWSVLLRVPETKVKNDRFESYEYILNPIYAPYFGISYNKGRRLELNSEEMAVILRGETEEYTTLIKQYEQKWNLQELSEQKTFDFGE